MERGSDELGAPMNLASMNEAYVGLGSSLGDRLAVMRAAAAAVAAVAPAASAAAREPASATEAIDGRRLIVNGEGGVSALYETGAVIREEGGAVAPAVHHPPFLNAVARVRTSLSPAALLERLFEIERRLGRVRPAFGDGGAPPDQPRIIDLDLLLYSDAVINRSGLVVPHPRLHLRRFVLEPLADLAAGFIHPVLHETIGALRDRLARERPEQWVRRVGGPEWSRPDGGAGAGR